MTHIFSHGAFPPHPTHSAQTLVILSSTVSYRWFPFYPKCFNPQNRCPDLLPVFYFNPNVLRSEPQDISHDKTYELAIWFHHSAGRIPLDDGQSLMSTTESIPARQDTSGNTNWESYKQNQNRTVWSSERHSIIYVQR